VVLQFAQHKGSKWSSDGVHNNHDVLWLSEWISAVATVLVDETLASPLFTPDFENRSLELYDGGTLIGIASLMPLFCRGADPAILQLRRWADLQRDLPVSHIIGTRAICPYACLHRLSCCCGTQERVISSGFLSLNLSATCDSSTL